LAASNGKGAAQLAQMAVDMKQDYRNLERGEVITVFPIQLRQ
jgi:hypothetical protein